MRFVMVIAGSNYHSTDRIVRGQGSVPGRSGREGYVCGENDFLAQILAAGTGAKEKTGNVSGQESSGKDSGNVPAQGEYFKNQTAGQLIRSAAQDGKQLSKEELLKLLADHREEILKKIKNGDTGVKIPIGSMYLTQEEWEKLLDSFDEAQEKMQEEIRAENGGDLPEKMTDTTVNGDKLFATEDTGHDLKPLEELLGGTDVNTKTADGFEEENLSADEEDEEQA